MSDDPARNRYFAMNFTRFLGVAFVIAGILIVLGRIDWPEWVGWLFIANGLLDIFVIPQLMARRWRTPKE